MLRLLIKGHLKSLLPLRRETIHLKYGAVKVVGLEVTKGVMVDTQKELLP